MPAPSPSGTLLYIDYTTTPSASASRILAAQGNKTNKNKPHQYSTLSPPHAIGCRRNSEQHSSSCSPKHLTVLQSIPQKMTYMRTSRRCGITTSAPAGPQRFRHGTRDQLKNRDQLDANEHTTDAHLRLLATTQHVEQQHNI